MSSLAWLQKQRAALTFWTVVAQGKQRPRFAAHRARQANGESMEVAAAAPVRRTPVVRESWGQGAWDTARHRRGAGGDEVGLVPGHSPANVFPLYSSS